VCKFPKGNFITNSSNMPETIR